MSSLRAGDEHLHHCDGSHRWSGAFGAGGEAEAELWQLALRGHLDDHLESMRADRSTTERGDRSAAGTTVRR